MTLFEFLMVLVSIIVGLGIAEILTGVAMQIRCRASSSRYWVHSCAVAFIFLALLQSWWELWDLHNTAEWAFYNLVLMLVAPSGLYLVAHLIFPDPMENSDLRKSYYGEMRSIWWLGVLITVSSTAFRPLAFGSELITWDNFASVILLIGFIALASSRNSVLHSTLVPAFLALLLWDIVRWHPTFTPT
jgi:hypothetical protein